MRDYTSLSNQNITINSLAQQYSDFIIPNYEVIIDGTNIAFTDEIAISNINVDTSLDKADSFSFTVTNAYDVIRREFKWLDKYFSIGKKIEIGMGYKDNMGTVFQGYITSVRFELNSWDQSCLVVAGLDYSFKLMKGIKSKVFSKMKDSDIAEQVISGVGLVRDVDRTSVLHDIVQQVGITDYQFLKWLADRNGYEFFVSGNKAYFRELHKNKRTNITLTWGKNLKSLIIEDDLNDQIGEVIVTSWDYKTKESITAKANRIKTVASGKDGRTILKNMLGSVNENYLSEAKTKDQANAEANAIQSRKAMQLVTGEAICIGIPQLRAGNYVELAGLGSKLSKLYYVTAARHNIDEDGFITTLTLGGNVV